MSFLLQRAAIAVVLGIAAHTSYATPATATPVPSAAPSTAVPGDKTAAMDDGDSPIAPVSGDLLNLIHSDAGDYTFIHNDSLKQALTRWCQASGWTLVWRVEVDYPIEAEGGFAPGTKFEAAVEQTMRAYWLQQADLKAMLYTKNQRLVITSLRGGRN